MTSGATDFCQVRSWSGDRRTIGRMVARYLAERAPLRFARLVGRWTRPGPCPGATAVASLLERWWPPLLEELQSLAAVAGVPVESVLASWAPPEVVPGGGKTVRVSMDLLGIRVTVPFDFLLGSPTRRQNSSTLSSLSRDGGARLNVDGRLYETVRGGHVPALQDTWGRFWR